MDLRLQLRLREDQRGVPHLSGTRPAIPVAAGCLVDDAGRVLIAQRPAGKIAAGQWEFPGGKIEPGESARQALERELHEELGIEVRSARPLIRITHDYADRTVMLDTWRVSAWAGTLHGREEQAFAWVSPAQLTDYPLLAADRPLVSALRLPTDYVFTAPTATQILERLPQLPRGCLLRLRLPGLDDAAYARLAADVTAAAAKRSIILVLDRDPQLAARLGAGWHATSRVLAGLRERPDVSPCLASCHDRDDLARARAVGVDAAVVGPVMPTSSHPGQPALGWKRFGELVAAANLPVYAIGGVGPREREQAFACYAQGVAGISAYALTSRSTA